MRAIGPPSPVRPGPHRRTAARPRSRRIRGRPAGRNTALPYPSATSRCLHRPSPGILRVFGPVFAGEGPRPYRASTSSAVRGRRPRPAAPVAAGPSGVRGARFEGRAAVARPMALLAVTARGGTRRDAVKARTVAPGPAEKIYESPSLSRCGIVVLGEAAGNGRRRCGAITAAASSAAVDRPGAREARRRRPMGDAAMSRPRMPGTAPERCRPRAAQAREPARGRIWAGPRGPR